MNTTILLHKFSIEEYCRLSEKGILQEDERVELIDGKIIDMTPVGSVHTSCVNRLNYLFAKLAKRTIVSVQNPIRIGEFCEPQPDIAILKYRNDFYAEHHPVADDVLLLIEVADSSLEYDREEKIPLYGRAGIPEVWLVNLIENCIEMFRSPSSEGYKNIMKFFHKHIISPESFPDIRLTVEQILGGSGTAKAGLSM
ncbi:MAG: Uma2 family endonuclease [Candidatus Brocadiaceae bacterium]